MDLAFLTTFLGWLTVLNIGFLVFLILVLSTFKGKIAPFHARLFNIPEEEVRSLYLQYLGRLQAMIIFFNLTPWIVLHFIL